MEHTYKRDVAPVDNYIDQSTVYNMLARGLSYEDSRQLVLTKLEKAKADGDIKSPVIGINYYDESRTKKTVEVPISKYIKRLVDNNRLIAPSLTAYMRAEDERSLLSGYTLDGTIIRKKYKGIMFKAAANKDKLKETIHDLLQGNVKFVINSISGACGSKGTILSNTTGHSTFTSITMMVTSTGCALAEKLLGGNRAYFNEKKVLFNLTYLASLLYTEGKQNDLYKSLKTCIEKYDLHVPSVDDVVDTIQWSTSRYWYKGTLQPRTVEFIGQVDDVVRSAFVYLGDLYHLRKYNEELMRQILTDMSKKETLSVVSKNLLDYKEDDIIHAHMLNTGMCKGKGKEYDTLFTEAELTTLAKSAASVEHAYNKYSDLLDTLCQCTQVPSDVSEMAEFTRETVLLSDTDSVGLTTDDWVKWYTKSKLITEDSYAVGSSLMYLFSNYLVHQLAMLSTNIGVEQAELHRLMMKNEYFWSVFIVAMSKHYYANTVTREGRVYDEPELEKKGVHLKNSALPIEIVKSVDKLMRWVLHSIETDGSVSITDAVVMVIETERMIYDSVLSGEGFYLKSLNVNSSDSYKDGEDATNYLYHKFWYTVLAPEYGGPVDPPYSMVKLNLTLGNKTKLYEHLDSMGEDNKVMQRWKQWVVSRGRKYHEVLYVPKEVMEETGIPKEIMGCVDTTSIILDLCNAMYLVLGTLGFHKPSGITLTEYVQS